MNKETRTVRYDEDLGLEAYRFQGIVQPFPNHFHDYYVIGYVEAGLRRLFCKNREYIIKQGDILLFNPRDNHGCAQSGGETLDYREINIPEDAMLRLSGEISGEGKLWRFSQNVVADHDAALCLRSLHQMMMAGGERFAKEEALLLLLSMLMERYGEAFAYRVPECGEGLEKACAFMEAHYAERISLEQVCRCSALSGSSLLRAFTREKGVTPYRYLQSVRVSRAKALLEAGVSPVEAALQAGFSDQSHLSNCFHTYIGLSPAAYRRIFQN